MGHWLGKGFLKKTKKGRKILYSTLLIILLLIIITVFITIYYKNSHITKVVKTDNIANENSTINGFKYNYSNPVIPKGFKTSSEGAEWNSIFGEVKGWNNGLIIEDEKGNQFVWVPVKDGIGEDGNYANDYDMQYKKWCTYEKDKFIGETYDDYSKEVIVDYQLPTGIESEEKQIKKYGGFYIGRYETGMDEENVKKIYNLQDDYETFVTNKRNNTVEATPVIKANSHLWNLISFNNLKIVCENMYKNEYVQSGVMTDRQFDTIMRWAYLSGYDLKDGTKWGNFLNTHDEEYTGMHVSYLNSREIGWKTSEYGFKETDNIVITSSGGVKRAKMNEIYDIAGNLFEYVNNGNMNYENSVIVRGGSASYNGDVGNTKHSIVNYSAVGKDDIHYILGFRVALFIK